MCKQPSFSRVFVLSLTFAVMAGAADLKTPISVADAKALLKNVRAAIDERKALDKAGIAVPGKLEDQIEALQRVNSQLTEYTKDGKVLKGILTWFRDENVLAAEDAHYLAEITDMCTYYAHCRLRFYRKELADADAKLLKEVQAKNELLGFKYDADEVKRRAAAIQVMDRFRPRIKKKDAEKLSETGVTLCTRCKFMASIAEKEWKDGLEELTTTGKLYRTALVLAYVEPIFEFIAEKKDAPKLP